MTEMERYIADNRSAFDSESVPAGSRERFMNRLVSERRKRLIRTAGVIFSGIAAACAAFMILFMEPDMSRTLERYHTRIAEMANEIMNIAETEYPYETEIIRNTVSSITDEVIPLEEQLPEELGTKEKTRILNEYYGQKYSALESLMAEL
jgi:hypothetical protein